MDPPDYRSFLYGSFASVHSLSHSADVSQAPTPRAQSVGEGGPLAPPPGDGGPSRRLTPDLSALLGGLCCVVPNGVFALRLYIGSKKPGTISPMTFFFGEFTKIAFTIALLAAVVVGYRDLNWLALIAAFIVALKSYIILLFRH